MIEVPTAAGAAPSGLSKTKQPPVLFCLEATACFGGHKRPIKKFLNPMYVFARDLTLAIQSINFACTDFWSPYLVQMGAGIRQSVADVDTDSLLSQNWPPNPPVHWRSCSETDSATTEKHGRKKTEKKHTERYGIPNFRRFRKSLATSSLYLVQIGAEIRQFMADVDTDSLLSQNWPPSMLVRHGS